MDSVLRRQVMSNDNDDECETLKQTARHVRIVFVVLAAIYCARLSICHARAQCVVDVSSEQTTSCTGPTTASVWMYTIHHSATDIDRCNNRPATRDTQYILPTDSRARQRVTYTICEGRQVLLWHLGLTWPSLLDQILQHH